MEISYKRNHNESFMVVEGIPSINPFEEKMLINNHISCFLPFYTMMVNGKTQFWYKITGKESLKDYLEHNAITVELLDKIFYYLSLSCNEIEKYVIRQENVLISPESIFLEKKENQFVIYLCYCPFELGSFGEQFRSVTELLLTMTDPDDGIVNEMCYELYELSMQDDQGLSSMLEYVQSKRVSSMNINVEKVDLSEQSNIRVFNSYSNNDMADDSNLYDDDDLEIIESDDYDEYEDVYGCDEDKGFFSRLFSGRKNKDSAKKEIKKNSKRKSKKSKNENKNENKNERPDFFGKRNNKKTYEDEVENYRDFEICPEDEIYTPTVLLSGNKGGCAGKLLYDGPGMENDFLINTDVFRIGSHRDSEAILHSGAVSHHHAKISRLGEDYYIEDLNSTNGTFVNGEILPYSQRRKLSVLDKITFADVAYVFM